MADNPDRDQQQLERRLAKSQGNRRSGGPGSLLEPMILTWRLFWDKRVGVLPKLIPVAAAIYVISPVDFIPELALGPIGMLDDVGVLLLAMNLFIWAAPPGVVNEHRQRLSSLSGSETTGGDQVVDGTASQTDDR